MKTSLKQQREQTIDEVIATVQEKYGPFHEKEVEVQAGKYNSKEHPFFIYSVVNRVDQIFHASPNYIVSVKGKLEGYLFFHEQEGSFDESRDSFLIVAAENIDVKARAFTTPGKVIYLFDTDTLFKSKFGIIPFSESMNKYLWKPLAAGKEGKFEKNFVKCEFGKLNPQLELNRRYEISPTETNMHCEKGVVLVNIMGDTVIKSCN